MPPGLEGSGTHGRVFSFHGAHGSARQQAELTGFDRLADRDGFLVVYPEGVDASWTTAAAPPRRSGGIDDVKLVRMIYDRLRDKVPVDSNRIYAAGLSNGAIFAARLACDLSDLFAAVGVVAGSVASRHRAACTPVAPVSVVSIIGDANSFIPIQGGEEAYKNHQGVGGALDSQADLVKFWAAQALCADEPRKTSSPVAQQDGTSVSELAYEGCKDGAAVLYTIAGGGHTWPPNGLVDGCSPTGWGRPRPTSTRYRCCGASSPRIPRSRSGERRLPPLLGQRCLASRMATPGRAPPHASSITTRPGGIALDRVRHDDGAVAE